MKKCYILFLLIAVMGCQKQPLEEQQVNLVVKAMVNGQWKVTHLSSGNNDLSSGFLTWLFQFRENNTVEALNSGNLEKTGSWSADASARTISSHFNNATTPLELLNGTWIIQSTTWTSVNATLTVNGEERVLRLDKQ